MAWLLLASNPLTCAQVRKVKGKMLIRVTPQSRRLSVKWYILTFLGDFHVTDELLRRLRSASRVHPTRQLLYGYALSQAVMSADGFM